MRINFPVSSQDMLKSLKKLNTEWITLRRTNETIATNLRTDLVRDVNMCGATTNLWIPSKKSPTEN